MHVKIENVPVPVWVRVMENFAVILQWKTKSINLYIEVIFYFEKETIQCTLDMIEASL